MTDELRTTLHRLADGVTPAPVADDLWQRGRAARRRGQILALAAVLVLIVSVGGVGVLALTADREARVAGTGAAGGAIPRVIPEPEGQPVTEPAVGLVSVAYVDELTGLPVLVDASTGEARWVELPSFPEIPAAEMDAWFHGPWLALSPDGGRLAYPSTTLYEREPGETVFETSWYVVVDLATGESSLVDVSPGTGTARAISWTSDGRLAVDVHGRPTSATGIPPIEGWTLDPATGDSSTSPLRGLAAPGGGISATYPRGAGRVRAVPFETADGTDPDRGLPADLYPDGASVTPVGWAQDHLLVAHVDAPAGSRVAGEHVVLLTSPDRPEREWTYRILVREMPAAASLSLAVDLIPDLDGTSSQQLTHDFGPPAGAGSPWRDRVPYLLGAMTALLAGLAFVRMLRHQV